MRSHNGFLLTLPDAGVSVSDLIEFTVHPASYLAAQHPGGGRGWCWRCNRAFEVRVSLYYGRLVLTPTHTQSEPTNLHVSTYATATTAHSPLGFSIICITRTNTPPPTYKAMHCLFLGPVGLIICVKYTCQTTPFDLSPSFHLAGSAHCVLFICLFVALQLPFSRRSLLWANRLRSIAMATPTRAKLHKHFIRGAVIRRLHSEMVPPTSCNK